MNDYTMLRIIKGVHTIVWIIMATASLYVLYAGVTQTFDEWLWVALFLLITETVILLANKMTCPLTPLAMKYTTDRTPNFDIYLPTDLARHNKIIFGTIFVAGLLLVILNLLNIL